MRVDAVPRERGDVLMDMWRLYVVLRVDNKPGQRLYSTLILAILDDSYGEHAGQLRSWGNGVESDPCLGKMELPATL
jgi:hypothetical protein